MASEKSRRAAAARLKKLDAEGERDRDRRKRNKLRATVSMGGRDQRKEATSELSGMARQRAQAKKMREEE